MHNLIFKTVSRTPGPPLQVPNMHTIVLSLVLVIDQLEPHLITLDQLERDKNLPRGECLFQVT